MTQAITFQVTVERHEPSGAFVARCADFQGKVGIGDTSDEAVSELRAHILRPVLQPIRPVVQKGNPWADLAEAFRDTPLLVEWKEELAERRRLSADAEREVP
jgi:hypothetical protein